LYSRGTTLEEQNTNCREEYNEVRDTFKGKGEGGEMVQMGISEKGRSSRVRQVAHKREQRRQ
jgi:hypothetical protein